MKKTISSVVEHLISIVKNKSGCLHGKAIHSASLFQLLHQQQFCITAHGHTCIYVHVNPPYILPQRPDEQIEIFVVAVRLGIVSIAVEINLIRILALLTDRILLK